MKKAESELAVPEVLTESLHTELAVVPVAPVEDRLSERAPDQVRKDVKRLRANVETNYWKLSEALWHVYDKVLYQGWGYASWRDYVESDVDFELRKAQYLVHMWGWRRALPAPAQERIEKRGLSGLRELATVMTADNWLEWLDKTEGMSLREVQKLVRGEADKEEDRLNGMTTGDAADADENKPAIQQKPVAKKFNLMRAQLDTVERALAKGCEIAVSESEPHALALICTEFLASHLNVNAPAEYLADVERVTGWRIVAVDPRDGKVLYGGALLEAAEGAPVEATVVGPGLPDPTADLAACLAAIEAATGARVVAFDKETPEVLFGEATLASIAEE